MDMIEEQEEQEGSKGSREFIFLGVEGKEQILRGSCLILKYKLYKIG